MGSGAHFLFGFKTMQRDPIVERIDNIATQAAKDNGVEFVHSEIVGSKRNMTVRIYIDKPEGVTLEDCSTVSRAIEAVMLSCALMTPSRESSIRVAAVSAWA